MGAMSDLHIDICDMINNGMSDLEISKHLKIDINWVKDVRNDLEEIENQDFWEEDDGQPDWQKEWSDFGESYE